MEQLRTWPGLTSAPASWSTGQALRYAECEIVHFNPDGTRTCSSPTG